MTHKPPPALVSVTVTPEQEQVIRAAVAIRCVGGRLSARQIGALVGRSERWARTAMRLIGVETRRMRVYGTRQGRQEDRG